jgi:hypothetical protein
MREWPPDSARGETAIEARKCACRCACAPRHDARSGAECVDLRMRHVCSSVRSEHADHSLPDNHAERSCRTIVAASCGCFVPERGLGAGGGAARRGAGAAPRGARAHIATDCRCRSAQTSHVMCISTNVLSQGHGSRSGGQYLRRKYEERAAATSDVPVGRRGGLHRPNGPRPPNGEDWCSTIEHRPWDLKRDHVQVWPLRQWERLTSQRARGDRRLVRSRRR